LGRGPGGAETDSVSLEVIGAGSDEGIGAIEDSRADLYVLQVRRCRDEAERGRTRPGISSRMKLESCGGTRRSKVSSVCVMDILPFWNY
jgi:hypothetical protein